MSGRALLFAIAIFIAIAAGAAAGQGAGTANADAPAREIDALVAALGEADCEFRRNGRWHGAGEARAHLQRKLDWARRRGMAGRAEDFIERAASRSSLTGREYRVRCRDGYEGTSADWFGRELRRLRQANSSQPPR